MEDRVDNSNFNTKIYAEFEQDSIVESLVDMDASINTDINIATNAKNAIMVAGFNEVLQYLNRTISQCARGCMKYLVSPKTPLDNVCCTSCCLWRKETCQHVHGAV